MGFLNPLIMDTFNRFHERKISPLERSLKITYEGEKKYFSKIYDK